ncbi:hypothetical protein SBY92_000758 [Candida maltosa Xu316]|uniref:Protein BIG1 n=1 Tax=Candida maltosa (strain Xu316) TaxID=1245528 RepID=M3IL82_CANMX|nr:hypothetical protein G210_2606 [Candida maltosa Xu316]
MVSITQFVANLALASSLAFAFSDTAPLFVDPLSNDSDWQNELKTSKYITKVEEMNDILIRRTEQMCSSEGKVLFYKVDKLSVAPEYEIFKERSFKNVLYQDHSNVELSVSDKCSDSIEYITLESASLEDIVAKSKPNNKIIIQVLPTFKTGKSLDAIKEKVYNLYNDEDIVISKKDLYEEEEGEDEAEIEQEIENDFERAESLAAESTEAVGIFDTDKNTPSNGTVVKHDNLFTKYQFFTSGIWSGLIVSGLLLFILYGALNWLSSLEISYASFEKQIDYDKKNE